MQTSRESGKNMEKKKIKVMKSEVSKAFLFEDLQSLNLEDLARVSHLHVPCNTHTYTHTHIGILLSMQALLFLVRVGNNNLF